MSTTTVFTILTVIGVVLVAMATAGRLHSRLTDGEVTNLKLEFATIAAVIIYLILVTAVADAAGFVADQVPIDIDVPSIVNRNAPPA